MTQKAKVLSMLSCAGKRGVTSNEFYGARLPRFAARLHELKQDGYRIDKEPVEDGFFRYELIAAPPQSDKRDLPPVAVLDSPQQSPIPPVGREVAGGSLPSTIGQTGRASRDVADGCSQRVEVAGRDVESGFSHKPESGVSGFEPVPLFELDDRRWADVA